MRKLKADQLIKFRYEITTRTYKTGAMQRLLPSLTKAIRGGGQKELNVLNTSLLLVATTIKIIISSLAIALCNEKGLVIVL